MLSIFPSGARIKIFSLIWLCYTLILSETARESSILGNILEDVIGPIFVPSNRQSSSNLPTSKIRRRCYDYLACEYHIPVVEIEGAIFHNGNLYLNNPDKQSLATVDGLSKIYAAKKNHLPSVLVQRGGGTDWIPGPRIIIHSDKDEGPRSCVSYWNTSAQFLFPWEVNNAFHSLNDNILSVISSVVMQHYYYFVNNPQISFSKRKTLFVFRKLGGDSPSISLLYRMINELFENDVQPVHKILRGGPHCIQHVTWGTAMKPFYRDSLIELRRVVFKIFHRTLRALSIFPPSAPELNYIVPSNKKKYPRVVIVTRNTTRADPSPFRKLSKKSENDLRLAFQRAGSPAVVCCNFKQVSNPTKLLSYFGHVDICIGIHGAGLTNCAFASENMILVELQNEHAFGFDSFMKISHMANGVYVFYDLRNKEKFRGIGAGAILDQFTIDSIVDISLRLFSFIEDQRKHDFQGGYSNLLENIVTIDNQIIHFQNLPDTSLILKESQQFLSHVKISDENKNKFLVIPSPLYSYQTGHSNSLLGPTLRNTTGYCKELSYYKFRKYLKSPMQEKDYCDRNFIHRKPGALSSDAIREFFDTDLGLLPHH